MHGASLQTVGCSLSMAMSAMQRPAAFVAYRLALVQGELTYWLTPDGAQVKKTMHT